MKPPRIRYVALLLLSAATVLLIPLRLPLSGAVVFAAALFAILRDPEPAARRRLGVLAGCVAVLAVAPIHTDTSNLHFVTLGLPFLAVTLGPALVLGRTDPGVIRYRLWPRKFRWLDVFYVAVSIPLAWLAFEFYFKVASPEVPTHWVLPAQPDAEANWRLFIGINCVGIWDELFFVNTVFAVLRSLFPYRIANLGQAVVYTSVLTRMAFTGIGPFLIFPFALTQGAMFEESDNLLYVLLVHLIVDFFLVAGIFHHYYGTHVLPF
jgi:hypothetical protein